MTGHLHEAPINLVQVIHCDLKSSKLRFKYITKKDKMTNVTFGPTVSYLRYICVELVREKIVQHIQMRPQFVSEWI